MSGTYANRAEERLNAYTDGAIEDMTTVLTAGLGAVVEYADKPDERSVGGAIH